MAILAYPLFFVPLITGDHNKSPFVKFHTNQGIVMWICCGAIAVVGIIVSIILGSVRAGLWWTNYSLYSTLGVINSLFSLLTSAPFIIFTIMGIINAVNGKMQELPVIGKMFKILK